jgi:hypothetical protein
VVSLSVKRAMLALKSGQATYDKCRTLTSVIRDLDDQIQGLKRFATIERHKVAHYQAVINDMNGDMAAIAKILKRMIQGTCLRVHGWTLNADDLMTVIAVLYHPHELTLFTREESGDLLDDYGFADAA